MSHQRQADLSRIRDEDLTPEQAAHPLFAELVEMFRQAEIAVVLRTRPMHPLQDS